jgi:hypothetical protein
MMPDLSSRLPGSLPRATREVASQDGVPVDYLRERGQGANENDLAAVLTLVPDAEPEERDRFPVNVPAP